MKDHPPLKRQQALLSFSRDHHSGLLLVWKIRQGLDKRTLFNHLQETLSPEDLEDVAIRSANDCNFRTEAWADKFWLK